MLFCLCNSISGLAFIFYVIVKLGLRDQDRLHDTDGEIGCSGLFMVTSWGYETETVLTAP